MRLESNGVVLATDVEIADTLPSKMRGLMFRRSIPDDYALVFRFDEVDARSVHMLFVPFPLTVAWLVDWQVDRVERLRPWTGFARNRADTLIELPANRLTDIEVGDDLRLVESP